MHCHECFHYSICGDSGLYTDASQCKQYINKSSIVSAEILSNVQDTCEDLRTKIRSLEAENKHLVICLEGERRKLRTLMIIKQTLEMASGMKFEF